MIRFATLLFVLTWNTAMATDAVQNLGMPVRDHSPAKDVISAENASQQYLRSPRGQYNLELQAAARRGELKWEDLPVLFKQRFPDPIGKQTGEQRAPMPGLNDVLPPSPLWQGGPQKIWGAE